MDDKWNRFLEWLAILIVTIIFWSGLIYLILSIIIIIFYPYSAVVFVLYAVWIFYDRKAGSSGNRKSEFVRNWAVWRYFRNYFPAKLIKTAELPANKNYILACHHHGVMPLSVVSSFGTEANHVGELFPGIDFRVVNSGLINLPILRELLLSFGFVDVSEFSITRLLGRNIPTGIVLFPGSHNEFGLNETGSNKFKIYASRKGFVRIALQTGASLVPVLVFGDTELFDKKLTCLPNFLKRLPYSNSFLRTVNGLYPNNFHIFPFWVKKVPLNTIVGAPIDVPKIDGSRPDLVDHYHKKFYEEFKNLFENYKKDYSPAGSSYELIIAPDTE